LRRGATFVGYSGGKCLRGPQCSGLILGRKDLLKAAWVSSAPHHGHGRTMKIGKEEIVGLLAAVEMWAQRDHQKEDEMWTQWMQTIADRVNKVEGVSASVRQPASIDNHSPGLLINWDPAKIGITGDQLADTVWSTEPRIALGRVGDTHNQTGVSVTAYMMQPDDVKIVADRLHEVLAAKRPPWRPESPQTPAGDLNGRWDVQIEFAAGSSKHAFHVKQTGNQLVGTHQGDFVARDFTGTISGEDVRISSNVNEVHGAALSYRFTGKLDGDKMSGALDMGEYLNAKWTAMRHVFGRGNPG
jgi:L-seryl-tRNA(Ser) seleniumtransferase